MTANRLAMPLISIMVLIAACAPAGATQAPAASSSPSAPTGSGAATRIVVTLTDSLRIEPAGISVPASVPVTFVVTNSGAIDHEFYLGDEAAQAEHEKEMVSMGGMAHDEPAGILVKPGETKELTYTFAQAGTTLAGCHVAGHYGGGMKAPITVTG
jgi:uncharacterized cupredoxin-like copper-binding protein